MLLHEKNFSANLRLSVVISFFALYSVTSVLTFPRFLKSYIYDRITAYYYSSIPIFFCNCYLEIFCGIQLLAKWHTNGFVQFEISFCEIIYGVNSIRHLDYTAAVYSLFRSQANHK